MNALQDHRSISAGAGAGAGAVAASLAAGATWIIRRHRRLRALRTQVRELMTTPVGRVREHEPVTRAAERLAQDGVGAVAVCDGKDRLIGMLSDRDIVVRLIAEGTDPDRVRAGEYTQTKPVTLCEHDTAAHALERMSAARVRRLPVLRGPRLVGIVGYSDLVAHLPDSDAVALACRLTGGAPDQRGATWLFRRADTDAKRDDPPQRQRQRRLDAATAAQAVRSMATGAGEGRQHPRR